MMLTCLCRMFSSKGITPAWILIPKNMEPYHVNLVLSIIFVTSANDKYEMKKSEPAGGKFGRRASQSCVAKNFRELDQIAFLS